MSVCACSVPKRKRGRPVAERFWGKVCKHGPDGCWVWLGAKDPNGYGVFNVVPYLDRAHRIAYELTQGDIPEGLTIDHLCFNKSCCNPAHLEAVSHQTNILRAHDVRGCINGHPWDEATIYIRPDKGTRQCRQCARERQQGVR